MVFSSSWFLPNSFIYLYKCILKNMAKLMKWERHSVFCNTNGKYMKMFNRWICTKRNHMN